MSNSTCLNDHTFGPAVEGCRGDFDFTLRFEQLIFTILPAGVFGLVAILRIGWLARRVRIVTGPLLQWGKLAAIVLLGALQLCLIIVTKSSNDSSYDTIALAATAMSFISTVLMLPLSYAEHSRAPRPSGLIDVFLLLQILLDIVQTRTSWLNAHSSSTTQWARLFTSAMVIKMLILVLESLRKDKWLKWDKTEHSPEESSGFFNLGVYAWLNRLFIRGFRSVMTIEDLYPLDQRMQSSVLEKKLVGYLKKNPTNGRKFGLVSAVVKTLAVQLLLPIGPRIFKIGFTYSQPLFLHALLEWLVHRPIKESAGYGLIGAAAFAYGGIAISDGLYWYYHQRTLYSARGCLVAVIYQKTTNAKLSDASNAASLTLMSTDIERIIRGFHGLHEFWANLIEVGIGCWLLKNEVGTAFVSPIVIILGCVILTMFCAMYSGESQGRWMSQIEKRVGLTSNVISNMKGLRISGITEPVGQFIQKMRVDEINIGNRFRWLMIFAATTAFIPDAMGPVVTFAFTNVTLTTTKMYTALSYIVLLTSPLGQLFQYVPQIVAGFTCFSRIQEFLEATPREDFRETTSSDNHYHGSGDSLHDVPLDMDEKALLDTIKMDNLKPSLKKQSGPSITLWDASFGWAVERMTLHNITVKIPSTKITMVVGPVASGKSTLCKAFLGEIPFKNGQIIMPAAKTPIGYCEQSPFLSNGTIKENIIGHSRFNQQRYEDVVDACMLRTDLAILAEGDETKIGSNGIMLSGGQKQRVSLARAMYLESDFLIIDDILSGLDNDTASEVFKRVFGPRGLARRRQATVVLVTHSVQYLPLSDFIIALGKDGTLIEDGSFEDLMKKGNYVANLGVSSAEGEQEEESTSEKKGQSQGPRPPRVDAGESDLETAARLNGDTAVYMHYLRTMSIAAAVLSLFTAIFFAVCHNFPTLWMRYWAADSFNKTKTFYIGIFALARSFQIIALFICCVCVVVWMTTESGIELHQQALTTVISAPLRFFTTTDTGVVTNLFSQDMTLIDGDLPMALLNVLTQGTDSIAMAAVVATASPYVAITYPPLLLILYTIQKFYLRTSRQLRLLDLEAKSPLYAHFMDTMKGIATIRAFNWVHHEVTLNHELLDYSQRPAYLLAAIQHWLTFMMHMIVMVLAIVVVTLATQLRGNSGFAGASLVTLMTWGETISTVIQHYTSVETSIGAVSRIKTFAVTVKPEKLEGEDMTPPQEWPENGAIVLKNVSGSYGIVTNNSDDTLAPEAPVKLALKDLTMSIKPGQKVALCGRTGSGKSSLILLLLRLLDPLPSCAENMEMDGIPLHRIDRETLRRRLIAVPQDAVFLPDGSSVKDNLDPFNLATNEECVAVLKAVQLTEFLNELGSTDAGMNADDLSAGQKQLFSLGRAILRRRVKDRLCGKRAGGILLLDEVSSNVDYATDRIMQEIIKEEFSEYTIVMVSHRLDMVMDFFDTVVVMDAGNVVETGSPSDLVQTEGTRFGELWAIQKAGRE